MRRYLHPTKIISLLISLAFLTGCQTLYQTKPVKNYTPETVAAGATAGLIVQAGGSVSAPASVALGALLGATGGIALNSSKVTAYTLHEKGVQVVSLGDTTTIYLPADKVFDINTAHIKRAAYPILSDVVKLVQRKSRAPVTITGNTDEVRLKKYSYTLAKNQARSIAAYLWAMGVNETRLQILSNGKIKPIATNHTLSGSHSNRHVKITISRLVG